MRAYEDFVRLVVQNLIMNAFEGANDVTASPERVRVKLFSREIGGGDNPSEEIVLLIESIIDTEGDRRASVNSLQRALMQPGYSDKRYGSGVGLALAQTLFDTWLAGSIKLASTANSVGLEMIMEPGRGSVSR